VALEWHAMDASGSTDGREIVEDRWRFVTVREAARILGLSVATIRRRARDGTLEYEAVPRPQGEQWLIRVPLDASSAPADASRDGSGGVLDASDAAPAVPVGAPVGAPDASGDASPGASPDASHLGLALVAQLGDLRRTAIEQAEQLGYQRARIEAAERERDALAARLAGLEAELAAARALPPARPGPWARLLRLLGLLGPEGGL
jgi:excisionase family DNA binding protein